MAGPVEHLAGPAQRPRVRRTRVGHQSRVPQERGDVDGAGRLSARDELRHARVSMTLDVYFGRRILGESAADAVDDVYRVAREGNPDDDGGALRRTFPPGKRRVILRGKSQSGR